MCIGFSIPLLIGNLKWAWYSGHLVRNWPKEREKEKGGEGGVREGGGVRTYVLGCYCRCLGNHLVRKWPFGVCIFTLLGTLFGACDAI